MCGIPDFRFAYRDAESEFFIEFGNPQANTCQRPRRSPAARSPQPQPQRFEPTPEQLLQALPLLAQLFQA
jgi:hypothetical protein